MLCLLVSRCTGEWLIAIPKLGFPLVTSPIAEPLLSRFPTRAAGARGLLLAGGEPIQILDLRLLVVKPGADHVGRALGCQ
jgi:hypothetical protein